MIDPTHLKHLLLPRFICVLMLMFPPLVPTHAVLAEAETWSAAHPLKVERTDHTATLLTDGRVLVAGGGNESGFLSSSELYDPIAGEWTITNPMNVARRYFTATLLQNGKVLVSGGMNDNSGSDVAINSAEVFDPSTGVWSLTGSMTVARAYHTATLLQDGTVLVVGGSLYGAIHASSELYDPVSGTWSPTGSMATGREKHTSTLLPGGKVLVAGGYGAEGSFPASTELYDPVSKSWSETDETMNTPRHFHTASLLPDGTVLVAGGYGPGFTALTSAEIYNPVDESWTNTDAMDSARRNHTASLLPNGKVLVAGGWEGDPHSAELYDPLTGFWTSTDSLAEARQVHTATLLADGQVLVVGGSGTIGPLASSELYSSAEPSIGITDSMDDARSGDALLLPNGSVLFVGGNSTYDKSERYDPDTGLWEPTGNFKHARYHFTTTLLANGKVLMTGGFDTDYLSSAELYDPSSGVWSMTGSLNTARYSHTATLLKDGRVLIAGGYGGVNLSSCEIYDPIAETWTFTGSLHNARSSAIAILLQNGKVLVIGGYQGYAMTSAELFDPVTGTWTETGSMSTPRGHDTATLLPNGKVLVVGGAISDGTSTNSAELYDPVSGSWTPAASLYEDREDHTATMLPNGKVLVVAGTHVGSFGVFVGRTSTELYDPITDSWQTGPSVITGRASHSATLLQDGNILLAGGFHYWDGNLASAEIYDPGLDYLPAWQPSIDPIPAPLLLGGSFDLSGNGFTGYGYSEASSGSYQNSASNIPVMQLMSLENEQMAWIPAINFTTTTIMSDAIQGSLPPGYARLTVFVNGIPGYSQIILLQRNRTFTPLVIKK